MVKTAVQYTVATPREDYSDKIKYWIKCRAVCGSEDAVKEHDLRVHDRDNFLIPFSPVMTQTQYDFLKREAELPGISAEFKQLLVGGLLRKEPELTLPKDVPAGALEWITNEFGVDGTPLTAFMKTVVEEEVETTRPWIQVNYSEEDAIPYATLIPAEAIINWTKSKTELTRVIVCMQEEVDTEYEFHPIYVDVIYVHELVDGKYQVRRFYQEYDSKGSRKSDDWIEDANILVPLNRNQPLEFIPLWPANGEIELQDPFLITIVNKEISLYNKYARRNHLLFGASTYTPYVSGVQDEAAFNKIVSAGLGSWLWLPDKDAKLDVLKAPTEALTDLDRAIAAGIEEMAKLGVRMLSPETAQSGVALQLRNASQTSRLGILNTSISTVMAQVIATMLNWRYGTEYRAEDIKFKLQDDFANAVQGEGWLRLATEWYENGHIPRSVFIQLLKQNDILPDDYNDEEGRKAIAEETERFRSYSDKVSNDE